MLYLALLYLIFQPSITNICPAAGIELRGATFEPGGIILTTFDSSDLWVYNIGSNSRYPLPDTAPCGANCHTSPDARWITYFNALDRTVSKMRLDGTQRTPLAVYASEVSWWTEDTLLIWTPGHKAYLRPEEGTERQDIDITGVVSIQPGGSWGMILEQSGEDFQRLLVNLETRAKPTSETDQINLGIDTTYFNAASWSPDGAWLAYVAPAQYDEANQTMGAEIFGIRPGDLQPAQWTDLFNNYGAVRINGHSPGELSWSPDGAKIAFWVTELLGPNPESNTGNAILHVLDLQTGQTRAYCNFSTTEHTPNPPRLVWSPDSTHIAFGGNIPGDERGYLLLALDIESGILTELSSGIFPALGSPDVIAWGN